MSDGKVNTVHAMKAYGSGGITLHILNLGTGWRWEKFNTRAALSPRKQHRYAPNGRLGVPHNRAVSITAEKNLLVLPGESNNARSVEPDLAYNGDAGL